MAKGSGGGGRGYSQNSYKQMGRTPTVGESARIRIFGGYKTGKVEWYNAGIGERGVAGRVGISGGWESMTDLAYPRK